MSCLGLFIDLVKTGVRNCLDKDFSRRKSHTREFSHSFQILAIFSDGRDAFLGNEEMKK